MYEQSQRDLRNKQQELQRTNAELDKTREMKDQLARENKKLGGDRFSTHNSSKNYNSVWLVILSLSKVFTSTVYTYSLLRQILVAEANCNDIFIDDLNDAKNQLADMNRRLHELELELRRLENEREELAAAYKEAEAVSQYCTNEILYYVKEDINRDMYKVKVLDLYIMKVKKKVTINVWEIYFEL